MASELSLEEKKSELMEKVAEQIENLHSKKFGEDHKINWYYYDDVLGEGDGKCTACGGKFTIRLKQSCARRGDWL